MPTTPPDESTVPASALADPAAGPVVVPAPWALSGRGVVIVYRASAASARANFGPTPGEPIGKLAALMLVDYAESDVGPYGELMAIPGLIRLGDRVGPSISRIWVTTQESVVSGRANWAIPKNLAQIERTKEGCCTEHWTASDEDGPLLELTHRPWGPRLPVAKPRWPGALLQHAGGRRYDTPISARGVARPTKLQHLRIDRSRLYDPGAARPIAAFSIEHFNMGFHEASVSSLG